MCVSLETIYCDGMNYPGAWPGGGKSQLRNFYGFESDCLVDLFLQSKTDWSKALHPAGESVSSLLAGD